MHSKRFILTTGLAVIVCISSYGQESLKKKENVVMVRELFEQVFSGNVTVAEVPTDDKFAMYDGVPASIWGWADEGEEVTVEFAGQTKKTTAAGKKGRWEIKLDPLEACPAASSTPHDHSTINPEVGARSRSGVG